MLARRFVDVAVAQNARVIGVSSMMMHTANGPEGPRAVRAELRERGLEDQIHLVVGGAPFRFDEQLHLEVGAEGTAESALDAVQLIARYFPESASC